MNAAFFSAVRVKLFGGALTQRAVDGINAIHAAWIKYGDGDNRKLAYIYATAYLECDRFKTMQEYASGSAYEMRSDLGNTVPGDGVRFKGRGFVQLTGRRNYADWAKRLGIDILSDPKRVCEPAIAARILVQGMMLGTFTGKGLPDYINTRTCDFTNARRTVNGTDKAETIAGYARDFLRALEAAGTAPAPVPIPPPPDVPEVAPEPPAKPSLGNAAAAALGAALMAAIGAILNAMGWL